MKARLILGTLVGLTSASLLWAQSTVALRTSAEPRVVYIGDPIRLSIAVTTSTDVALVPLEKSTALGDFEILDARIQPAKTVGDRTQVQIDFLLTTFSTGALTIPAINLRFGSVSGEMGEASTESVPINMKSLLEEKGDEGNLRPLKGLYHVRSYLWIAWVVGGSALIGVVVWLWRRRLKNLPAPPPPPPRPAEEEAWEALHRLEDSDLLARQQFKEFYSGLSDIFRRYLERRYDMMATERTTSELILDIRRLGLSTETSLPIREFLLSADLVKFAKFIPALEEVSEDLNRVKQFLNRTTPVKKETPPTAAEAGL